MIATETSNKAVVVMLTQTHEAGREKCFKYWPSESSGANFEMPLRADSETEGFEGFVSLVSKKEDSVAKCTIRRLKLRYRTRSSQDSKEPPWEQKDIYHLLFAGWPDFATPEGDDREALLELVNLSRRLNAFSPPPMRTSFPPAQLKDTSSIMADELNPRVVHCSAGVGRSGTFIAIDHLFTLLDAGRLDEVEPDIDPISDTVDQLRQQRMMMVQGETQFLFLYEVLRDAWLARWFEVQQRLAVAEEEKGSE